MSLMPFWSNPTASLFGTRSLSGGGEAGSALRLAHRQGEARTARSSPGPALTLEALSLDAAALEVSAWADLVSRSLEPNVFMEPGFCLAAAQHLALPQRPMFLFVWSSLGGARRLLAVCPLLGARLPLAPARAWFHDLSALGAPLLDRHRGAEALGAIFSWLAERRPACGALVIHALPVGGPTARILHDLARSTGRKLRLLDARQRAVLPNESPSQAGLKAVSRRKAKEMGRQRRRLEEAGELAYASATGGDALRSALEDFLRLEAEGWKGARRTALILDPGRAAFVRAMAERMGQEGKCRVDSLTLAGRPIAMGIVLSSGGRDFFWKTAYADAHARLSPGVQFVLGLTEVQQRNPHAALTDSCAAPDHPMIDRLWPARLMIADAVVAVRPGDSLRFRAIVAGERLRRRLRTMVKRRVAALRAWRDH